MTTAALEDKEAIKKAKEAKQEADLAEEKSLNANRTGKGTRIAIGYTRGKGSQRVKYEAFDEALPETLPVSIAEFMELAKVESSFLPD